MTAKATIYNQKGESVGDVTLEKAIFEVEMNHDLVHRAVVRQEANARRAIAHVKTRGEIRGGGRKPHRQKGTGRARMGSSRVPQARGGGAVFGPRNTRNFSKMMPKKQRRKALFCALSSKASGKQVMVLDKYDAKEVKTKTFAEMIKKLPVERNVLVVLAEKNELVQQSARNLPNAKVILANYLNVKDVLKYQSILFVANALDKVSEVFISSKKATSK